MNLSRIRSTLAGLSLSLLSLSAQAYWISYESENPLINGQALFELTEKIGRQAGTDLPSHEKIRVAVRSRAKWVPSSATYLYLHEVELQRKTTGIVAPYPGDYWISVYTQKSWGVGSPDETTDSLADAIRDFFQAIKTETRIE